MHLLLGGYSDENINLTYVCLYDCKSSKLLLKATGGIYQERNTPDFVCKLSDLQR